MIIAIAIPIVNNAHSMPNAFPILLLSCTRSIKLH